MPIPDRRKKHLAIGTDDFVHDPERDLLICPEGQVVPFRRLQEHEDRQVRVYQAPAAVCHACSRYGTCVPPRDRDDRKGRMGRKSLHHLAMGEHQSWMATPDAQTLAKQRKGIIEGVIGTLKTQLGAGRAKGRGRATVRAEWQLACAVYNLKKLHKAWSGGYGPALQARASALLG